MRFLADGIVGLHQNLGRLEDVGNERDFLKVRRAPERRAKFGRFIYERLSSELLRYLSASLLL